MLDLTWPASYIYIYIYIYMCVCVCVCICYKTVIIFLMKSKVKWRYKRAFFLFNTMKILDAYSTLRKATVSFVMSVGLSVCPYVRTEQLGSRWTYWEVWHSSIFRTSAEKSQLSLKSDKNDRYFVKTNIYFWSYLAQFLEREIFQSEDLEKIKTHISYSVTFFQKSCSLGDNVEKCGSQTGHIWKYNMTHALCMLEKQG